MVLDSMEMVEIGSEDPYEVTALYAARGWGDGLPLVAPTAVSYTHLTLPTTPYV